MSPRKPPDRAKLHDPLRAQSEAAAAKAPAVVESWQTGRQLGKARAPAPACADELRAASDIPRAVRQDLFLARAAARQKRPRWFLPAPAARTPSRMRTVHHR